MTSDSDKLEEVTPIEADELLQRGSYLLDVREDDEWKAGHAPLAHHIALGELELRYQEIPVDRVVVCVCRGGGRSARAAAALAGVGYRTVNLAGGMRAWVESELAIISETEAVAAII
ncbi:MAG TPA: rhodanese-like domain-containing protein [Acidimicrobiales bacterium]|nr:rhodanese-like domain-containing protein [Acidimicrobiales bacterium]